MRVSPLHFEPKEIVKCGSYERVILGLRREPNGQLLGPGNCIDQGGQRSRNVFVRTSAVDSLLGSPKRFEIVASRFLQVIARSRTGISWDGERSDPSRKSRGTWSPKSKTRNKWASETSLKRRRRLGHTVLGIECTVTWRTSRHPARRRNSRNHRRHGPSHPGCWLDTGTEFHRGPRGERERRNLLAVSRAK